MVGVNGAKTRAHVISLVIPAINLRVMLCMLCMCMKKHISEKCRIASLKLYNIKKIRKYLTHDSLVRLVNALVLSHLDYCNALLIGLPDSTIRPLQNVQNSAARVILGTLAFVLPEGTSGTVSARRCRLRSIDGEQQ